MRTARLSRPGFAQNFARNAAQSAYPDLWKGLVGAWVPALGPTGKTLYDVSGRHNDGILTNMDPATDWVTTEKGPALQTDGSNDRVAIGNPDILKLNNNNGMSIAVLAKHPAADYAGALFSKASTSFGVANQRDIDFGIGHLALCAGGDVRLAVTNGAAYIINCSSEFDHTDTDWFHLVATWTGGTETDGVRIYLDGNLIQTATASAIQSTVGTEHDWNIAGNADGNSWEWRGFIASTAIWNRALASSEVQHLNVDPVAPFRLARSKIFGLNRTVLVRKIMTYYRQMMEIE